MIEADQLFRQSQLESVKAWLHHPEQAAVPLYLRIQRAIRQMILEGSLSAGRALPASRALAVSLGVSRDTIEAAYNQLHAEGFIERRTGSGSFVSERTRLAGAGRSPLPRPAAAPGLSQRGQALWQAGGVREVLQPRPFTQGVPETRQFPLHIWEKLQRQVLKEWGSAALLLRDPQGTLALRQAIADYVNLERGAHASAERVLVLTSSQQALMLCATVLLDPGEAVFTENPLYHGARRAFEAAGLVCTPLAVDEQGLQTEQLQQHPVPARMVYITPSHQFPTGATLTLERRLALIEWARQRQGWIIEDDYDSEFHYQGRPMACVQGLDAGERTLYIGTFSKSLFPGLRLAYMVLPESLVGPMTVARTLQDGHSAPLPQLTLARFIDSGHFGAYLRSMRHLYAGRLSVLTRLVQEHLEAVATARPPAGGLQLPCYLQAGMTEQDFLQRARQQGIEALGLSDLYLTEASAQAVLLGFAASTPEEMTTAMKKLAQALRRR